MTSRRVASGTTRRSRYSRCGLSSKKSPNGFFERIEALKSFFQLTDEIVEAALSKYRRKEVAKDDILDALAAAITAKMGCEDGFEYVPCEPETDSKGLKIQMVYCIPKSAKIKS